MAAFVFAGMTTGGLNILAKGQLGKEIRFSRIVLGDGYLAEGQTPRTTTALVHEVFSLPIPENGVEKQGDGEVLLWAPFTSSALESGFFYREVGAFAIDPDSDEEVLYCYGNAKDEAEWIPAGRGSTLVEKLIKLVAVIGDTECVTAHLQSGIVLIPKDLENHNQDPHAHENRTPTHPLATIRHSLNRYPVCQLFEARYAADTAPAGEGPAGGEPPVTIPAAFRQPSRDRVEVVVPEAYAGEARVQQLEEDRFAILYPEGVRSLILLMR